VTDAEAAVTPFRPGRGAVDGLAAGTLAVWRNTANKDVKIEG